MSLKDFQLIKKLGQGAYSSVYQVMRLQDKQMYALKKVKLAVLSPKQRENALNQVRILASVNHPNIISYKQAFIDENSKSLCIVMEFASGGDLSQKIQKCIEQETQIQQKQIWDIFIQVIKGLKTLHDMGILHRDIKSANVFLFDNGNAKLGDMNVSKVSSQKGLCMTQTGTPYYASPEVWKDQPYDFKSDIWSIGCVLYQMVTLKPPFRAPDMEGLYKKVVRGIYPRIPQQYSTELSDVIRSLLQTNPNNRPNCQKILKASTVIKRMSPGKQRQSKLSQRNQLLRTIRAGQNIYQISNQLPKANYQLNSNYRKYSKSKVIKNIIQHGGQEKQQSVYQTLRNCGSLANEMIDSLPYLQKQSKIKPGQSSQRPLVRKRSKVKIVQTLQKKRSHTDCQKDMELLNGVHYHYQNKESVIKQRQSTIKQSSNINNNSKKEIKLPKVANRYTRELQKIKKQRSLKVHKLH